MDQEFLMKIFVTRWIVFILVAVVATFVVNIVVALLEKKYPRHFAWNAYNRETGMFDEPSWFNKIWSWHGWTLDGPALLTVAIIIFHAFTYNHHFHNLAMSLGAGTMTGAGIMAIWIIVMEIYSERFRTSDIFCSDNFNNMGLISFLSVLFFPLAVKFIEPTFIKLLL